MSFAPQGASPLRTHEDDVKVAVPLRRSWTEIERTPCDETFDTMPTERVEPDGTRVIPIVEEVLVRRYRVTEELRLVSRSESIDHDETVTLRRQEATITEDPNDDPSPDDRSQPAA